jgi:glycosyltransferase involved in cell wall biosynthesis
MTPPSMTASDAPQSEPPAPLACSAVLTHHWLVRVRGGEKVLEACGELLPDAPLYTLVHDPRGMTGSPLATRTVHTSVLQRLPGARRHYPKLLPLHAWAYRRVHLPPVDLVLCSDAALAKAMTAAPRSRVVCYCHSPARYIWDLADEYARTLPAPLRPLWGPLCRRLQQADRRAAQRVDLFIANSQHVAARIRRHYGRDAVVIHPPVELPPGPATGPREDFLLAVGYHVPYKRLDLAVAASRRLRRRLVVIGDGPDVRRIDPARDRHVERLGWQPAEVIQSYLKRAAALLFPGEEDFGIVPVEAIAHGCPVVAYGVGGATETVVPDRTGVWFAAQTTDALADAIERCAQRAFDPRFMYAHAQQFSRARFLRELRARLMNVLSQEA